MKALFDMLTGAPRQEVKFTSADAAALVDRYGLKTAVALLLAAKRS